MKTLLIITIILYLLSFVLVALSHSLFRGHAANASRKRIARFSTILLVVGLIVHSIALVLRSSQSGHAPMYSIYETLLFYSWAVVLVSLIVVVRYKERITELITVPMATSALVFAFFNASEPRALTLILRTRWFETHVISSFAAYALFTLSFSSAIFYLVFRARGLALDERLKAFQDITSRAIMWGFLLFSSSMFAGAVWGYLAWGTYWMWEPKIIWSFIVWFFYAGAMHAYYVKQWRGLGLSIATVIGYFVVLFTYLGVGLLMKSSHSF